MSYMLQGSLLELLQHPHFDTALLESLNDYNETGLGCVCVCGGGGGVWKLEFGAYTSTHATSLFRILPYAKRYNFVCMYCNIV